MWGGCFAPDNESCLFVMTTEADSAPCSPVARDTFLSFVPWSLSASTLPPSVSAAAAPGALGVFTSGPSCVYVVTAPREIGSWKWEVKLWFYHNH